MASAQFFWHAVAANVKSLLAMIGCRPSVLRFLTVPFFLLTMALSFSAITARAQREPVTSTAPPHSYLGFDSDVYPGDAALPILRKTFSFTGYWVGPPPEEKSSTWLGKRELLRKLGFGFLVLYRGRTSHEFDKSANGTDQGAFDAQQASSAAKKEGFPPGTIIFLDVEEGGRFSPTYHAYLHAWSAGLTRAGYRPGVYCSGMAVKETGGVIIVAADDIRAHSAPHEFSFWVYNDACPPSPGCAFAKTPLPSASGVPYARVWQFAQSPRRKEFAASCPPGYRQDGNCYAPSDAPGSWSIDVNAAATPDPSSGR